MNRAPRIVDPENTEDLVLTMEFENTQVTVFARDPDGDALNFVWITPPGSVVQTFDGDSDTLQYSTLSLMRDPTLHGRRIRLAIDDGEDEVFVDWLVQMPGAK